MDMSEIDYINAHGTSTPAGDPSEIAAVRAYLANRCLESAQQNH